MKKFINAYDNIIEEMLAGFVAANCDKVEKRAERVIAGKGAPFKDKVGIITGGGSGHKPAFIGYIGEGMLDAVAVGNIFAAPGVKICYDAIKAADSGKGVLVCIGNYSGDTMNFGMAVDMLREEGANVEIVVVNDDVASSPKERMENRRGVAGEIILWKVVGALAAMGPLYGSAFSEAGKIVSGKSGIGYDDFVKMWVAFAGGIGKRGEKVGEKTMYDTIRPAIDALEAAYAESKSLKEACVLVDIAAKAGMNATKDMLALRGRSSRLGERSLGHIDPGAASMYTVISTFFKSVSAAQ